MEPIDRNAYPPEALMQQALELFFHHIYPIPVFSFLHQATITERYYAGTLDKCLAFAIVGIVSVMFDIDEATKRRGGRYVDIAEDAIVSSRESPAVSKIQALVIIIKYRAARRQFAAVFMLTAIAMRSATALRMNYEDHSLSFLTREECRRTMWSLYMIDTILAGGYQDFSLCPDDIIHIQLPCHERNYELDLPADVENRIDRDVMVRTADLSSLSLAIRVMSLRHRVLKFTKKVVALQSLGFHDGVVELQAELDMFSNQLPQALRFSEKNARLHSYSNSFAAFATMHIIWHGAHCILYRLVVGGFKEALPRTVLAQTDPALILHCQQKCLHHAIALADVYRVILLYRSHKPRLDVDIAVSAYQSVRIMLHLHNMLPGMVESGDLLSKVGYCQEFLDQIFPRCEAIDHVREDLKQLVDCGLSRPTTPAPPESSMEGSAAARTPGSHHILSRHSLVGQMSLPSKLESRQDNGRLTPVDDDDAERLERPPLLALEHQVSSCGDLGQNIHTTETRLDHGVRGVPSDLLGDNLSESLYPAFPDLVQFEMDSSIWLQTPLADANTIPEADQPLL